MDAPQGADDGMSRAVGENPLVCRVVRLNESHHRSISTCQEPAQANNAACGGGRRGRKLRLTTLLHIKQALATHGLDVEASNTWRDKFFFFLTLNIKCKNIN